MGRQSGLAVAWSVVVHTWIFQNQPKGIHFAQLEDLGMGWACRPFNLSQKPLLSRFDVRRVGVFCLDAGTAEHGNPSKKRFLRGLAWLFWDTSSMWLSCLETPHSWTIIVVAE